MLRICFLICLALLALPVTAAANTPTCANGACSAAMPVRTFTVAAERSYQVGSFQLGGSFHAEIPRPLPLVRRVVGLPFRVLRGTLDGVRGALNPDR